ITINAGNVPPDHWVHDASIGGGRIIGELCHFIDLAKFLAGRKLLNYSAAKMASVTNDTLSLQMGFEDGSIATVHYFANGNKAFPKERVEVFCAGKILCLDNFRKLTGHGWKNFKKMSLFRQDKGHNEEVKKFIATIRAAGQAPVSFEEIIDTTKISLELDSI
ncbi:dehydrogenase, partial [Candidatus Pacearchaeota archaeon]|nr:dehydrogenase [Candidatus Pacearchaeota archaeon]